MNFRNAITLRATYVRANGPDPDDTVYDYSQLSGQVPRMEYPSLKGSASSMAWPQGSSTFVFSDIPFPQGPNLCIDPVTDDVTGIRSWSITAEPSKISGRLEVAYYLYGNGDDASPDSIATYNLIPGAWDTGDLPIYTGDFTGDFYRYCRIRFTPGPLLVLL